MIIRGWVYVVTNISLEGLVKIGYTLKDPSLRAKELRSSGIPNNYNVIYEVLTTNPREVEQEVHSILKEYRENKEWFRCSVSKSINTIQSLVMENIIYEQTYDITVETKTHPDTQTHDNNKKETQNQLKISTLEEYLKSQDNINKCDRSIDKQQRDAYNHRHSSLLKEFKSNNHFTLEGWKVYARKHRDSLEPIPCDSSEWLI